jgi:hypothetical protein
VNCSLLMRSHGRIGPLSEDRAANDLGQTIVSTMERVRAMQQSCCFSPKNAW